MKGGQLVLEFKVAGVQESQNVGLALAFFSLNKSGAF
jgi:hypothetical protein